MTHSSRCDLKLWLHDRWYVWLVLAKSPNNGQVLLKELLSQRDY